MKRMITMFMMAMVLFVTMSTKVEAKGFGLKERMEAEIEDRVEEAMDDELGLYQIFLKEKSVDVTIDDMWRTYTVDMEYILDGEKLEYYANEGITEDLDLKYHFVCSCWTGEIISYEGTYNGEPIEGLDEYVQMYTVK